MPKNGRKQDVLIEDEQYTDPQTGVLMFWDYMTVWADENMKSVIESVEGVTNVYEIHSKIHFHVYYDKRYEREYLKREIEAVVLCAGEK